CIFLNFVLNHFNGSEFCTHLFFSSYICFSLEVSDDKFTTLSDVVFLFCSFFHLNFMGNVSMLQSYDTFGFVDMTTLCLSSLRSVKVVLFLGYLKIVAQDINLCENPEGNR
ncbi:hypothetical protein L9F63_007862, partial [Diploptera punctata]